MLTGRECAAGSHIKSQICRCARVRVSSMLCTAESALHCSGLRVSFLHSLSSPHSSRWTSLLHLIPLPFSLSLSLAHALPTLLSSLSPHPVSLSHSPLLPLIPLSFPPSPPPPLPLCPSPSLSTPPSASHTTSPSLSVPLPLQHWPCPRLVSVCGSLSGWFPPHHPPSPVPVTQSLIQNVAICDRWLLRLLRAGAHAAQPRVTSLRADQKSSRLHAPGLPSALIFTGSAARFVSRTCPSPWSSRTSGSCAF